MEYCSPSKKHNYKENKSCFDNTALKRIIEAYNLSYPSTPIITKNKTFKTQLADLHNRFKDKCNMNESCVVSSLGLDNDDLIDDYVRPIMPSDWKQDPNTWLSNFNIEAVLIQYEDTYKPFYKFFGVYSANFLRKIGNSPVHHELYNFNMADAYSRGVRTFGIVINLDDHDEPGSHWTSLFVCIDSSMQCFGAYYYDSTAYGPPEDMKTFMDKLKIQGDEIRKSVGSKPLFKVKVNEQKQQYGSTECGIFSIYNQLKWVFDAKNKNGKITFNKIMSEKKTDKEMSDMRKLLFRPLDLKI
jgi:hypothetical protein